MLPGSLFLEICLASNVCDCQFRLFREIVMSVMYLAEQLVSISIVCTEIVILFTSLDACISELLCFTLCNYMTCFSIFPRMSVPEFSTLKLLQVTHLSPYKYLVFLWQ